MVEVISSNVLVEAVAVPTGIEILKKKLAKGLIKRIPAREFSDEFLETVPAVGSTAAGIETETYRRLSLVGMNLLREIAISYVLGGRLLTKEEQADLLKSRLRNNNGYAGMSDYAGNHSLFSKLRYTPVAIKEELWKNQGGRHVIINRYTCARGLADIVYKEATTLGIAEEK